MLQPTSPILPPEGPKHIVSSQGPIPLIPNPPSLPPVDINHIPYSADQVKYNITQIMNYLNSYFLKDGELNNQLFSTQDPSGISNLHNFQACTTCLGDLFESVTPGIPFYNPALVPQSAAWANCYQAAQNLDDCVNGGSPQIPFTSSVASQINNAVQNLNSNTSLWESNVPPSPLPNLTFSTTNLPFSHPTNINEWQANIQYDMQWIGNIMENGNLNFGVLDPNSSAIIACIQDLHSEFQGLNNASQPPSDAMSNCLMASGQALNAITQACGKGYTPTFFPNVNSALQTILNNSSVWTASAAPYSPSHVPYPTQNPASLTGPQIKANIQYDMQWLLSVCKAGDLNESLFLYSPGNASALSACLKDLSNQFLNLDSRNKPSSPAMSSCVQASTNILAYMHAFLNSNSTQSTRIGELNNISWELQQISSNASAWKP